MLVEARLCHIAGIRWGSPRRYLNMNLLAEFNKEEKIAA
jgi:hypothetical protein